MQRIKIAVLAITLVCGMTLKLNAQTAFSYQGQLKQNNSNANGNFNMTFKLFDAVSAGTQQGSTLTFDGAGGNPPPVAVSSGLFTVSLDFGVGPFVANAPRWLEIAVNGNTLSPRQPLTPAPFALNTRGVNVDASGKVGVGTASPAQKLSVVGTIQSTSGGFMFPDGTTQTTASTGGGGINFWSQSGSDIFKNNAGNVGIGTNTPTSMLDVRGLLTLDAGGDAGIATGTGNAELNRYLSIFNSLGFTSASGLKAGGILCSDSYFYANPGKSDLVVKGSVAIGTPTLAYPLTIKTLNCQFCAGFGWVHTDGTRELASYVDSSGGWLGTKSNDPLHFFTNNSTQLMTLSTAGNFGIGTTTPLYKLDVRSANGIRLGMQGNGGGSLVLANNTNDNRIFLEGYNSGSNGSATEMLLTGFAGGAIPQITLRATTTKAEGTLQCNVLQVLGADVAEKFPTAETNVEPGTVMEIDPDHQGRLRIARGEYNTRVAGVVSGAGDLKAGTVLGHSPGNEDAPPIALSGRVWVKCDASSAAINIGDMLTTSGVTGRAMKAVYHERSNGAIIGKAMSKLAKGESGLVLVLVNLQ